MKILGIADEECQAFWDYYVPGRLKEYDLIISCGDLKASYLSFVVTMARAPLLYVHGNHDTGYAQNPPEGCDCIDGKLVNYKGLRILGLGGCLKYHEGDHQYTDEEMRQRIKKLRRQIERVGGVDIVVAHTPPEGIGDGKDYAHRGFPAFLDFIDSYHPTYLLHGHIHSRYGGKIPAENEYHGTKVINVGERYCLEIPDPVNPPERKKGISAVAGIFRKEYDMIY